MPIHSSGRTNLFSRSFTLTFMARIEEDIFKDINYIVFGHYSLDRINKSTKSRS